MVRTRRTLATATLVSLVLVPSLASARPAAAPKGRPPVHATSSSSSLLARALHALRNLWGKEGMTIDPNGIRINGATTRTGDPGAMSDNGMLIDPNG